MKVVGVTGGIGSGKSYVARLLAGMGYAVYDTDTRAKALYNEDHELRRQIIALWGDDLYDEQTGLFRRERLAQIVFSDKDALRQVNALVHPRVRMDFALWTRREQERGADLCFIESAIILGSPLEQMIDALWVVVADDALRLQRAMRRDGADEAAIRRRMAHQAKGDSLLVCADCVIYNNDATTPLLPQIQTALARMLAEPGARN